VYFASPVHARAFLLGASPLAQAPSYLLFEGGPVRPVALSPNGLKLFVANTPDGYLEIYDVGPEGLLTPSASVPVGLEPVAVAARSNSEVWVVNHLSDSVSIVDVLVSPPRVRRTLLVGDEPRDLVFAGSPQRAFISSAHRGQQRVHGSIAGVPGAGDPQLTTEGIGRADVWVFDAATPGTAIGGLPLAIRSFFADTPRALATDGTTVYVAAFLRATAPPS
jgi:DNA-binding beta-propeller fold protein YncE